MNNSSRYIQHKFRLEIFNGGKYVDYSEKIAYGVSLEMEINTFPVLSFTAKGSEFVTLLGYGIGVRFSGGTFSNDNYAVLFEGRIKQIKYSFKDNGLVDVSATCYGTAQNKLANSVRYERYPSPTSSREWAKKSSLTVEEIVSNIANENNLTVKLFEITKNKSYTYTDSISQESSDWVFLQKLAERYGCFLYQEGVNDIYFVDKSKVLNADSQRDIEFIYPLRERGGFSSWNTEEGADKTLLNKQLLMRSVSVEIDISSMTANTRKVTKFDNSGQEYKLLKDITEDNNRRVLTYYVLDEEKVAQIRKTDPDYADYLMQNIMDVPFEEVEKFFRLEQRVDERFEVLDAPYFGITITCNTVGNIYIRPYRSYALKGLVKYSGKYLCTKVTHTWEESGYEANVEFKR